ARESSVAADDSEISTALDGSNVRLKFNGDCWLMVKDGNGKTLFSGIKKAGQQLDLEGKPPFKFAVGAAKMVKLEYRGKAVDMTPHLHGRTARFSLPQE
ncbi:MAG: RodZ domain-containing protein, partial [Aeromonas sp.]